MALISLIRFVTDFVRYPYYDGLGTIGSVVSH